MKLAQENRLMSEYYVFFSSVTVLFGFLASTELLSLHNSFLLSLGKSKHYISSSAWCKQTKNCSFGMSDKGWCDPLQLLSWCLLLTFVQFIHCLFWAKTLWMALNPHPSDPLFDCSYLHSSLSRSSLETRTAYVHSERSVGKPHMHKYRWKKRLLVCVNKRLWEGQDSCDIWYIQSPSCCWWSKELPLIV